MNKKRQQAREKLDAKLAPARAWYEQREPREQRILQALALLVAAALVGTVLPLFLKSRNIDPALAGSVILTTVTDVVGFMAFLGLATLFYA